MPGLNFSPSGFYYGSIYSGTPFPAAAAVALGRLGLFGEHLSPALGDQPAYVVVPSAASAKTTGDVIHVIEQLQREKVNFGILHEDCLQTALPKSARVLIAPVELSPSSTSRLEQSNRVGIRVLKSAARWKGLPELSRIITEPRDGIDVLVRPTRRGTLYTLMTTNVSGPVKVTLKHGSVAFGLDKYGVIEENSSGVTLIEAAGEIKINEKGLFQIQMGRALISSDDGKPLDVSARVRILATEPTDIHFARPIRSAAVLQPGITQPIATMPEFVDQTVLKIDSELIRYVTLVELQDK